MTPRAAPGPIRVAAGDGGDGGDGGWTYAWDHARKPHLHPVATPSGRVLTQVEPEDHPWQRGIWFVVKYVDGDNFWEENDPRGWGRQRHDGPPEVRRGRAPGGGGTADGAEKVDGAEKADGGMVDGAGGVDAGVVTVAGDLSWVRPDGATVAVREHRELRHVPIAGDAYAIDWDVTLTDPGDGPVELDREPHNGLWGGYSGLAFRGRSDWAGTRLLVDDGTVHDRLAPHRSRWCDLSGPVAGPGAGGTDPGGTDRGATDSDGTDAGGVCILDHPANPSFPVPFYATCRAGLGYGDGWANTVYPSFLWDGPLILGPGGPLRFRYRVVVHDGVWDAPRAEDAWSDFTATA